MMMAEQPMAFGAWIKRYVGEQNATKMRFSVEELRIAFDAGVSTPKPADPTSVAGERAVDDAAVLRRAVLGVLPCGNDHLPGEKVIAFYIRMDELRALRALATNAPDAAKREGGE